MKTFNEFITEAYSAKMKEFFSPEQLKLIGKTLSKMYDISVQDSNFEHYSKKNFKPSVASKNGGFIITKNPANDELCIIHGRTQRKSSFAFVIDGGFRHIDEVFYFCTDFFVMPKVADVTSKKYLRKRNSEINDPLMDREHINRRQKVQDKISQKNDKYINEVNSIISKWGFKFEELYIELSNDRYHLYATLTQEGEEWHGSIIHCGAMIHSKSLDGLRNEILKFWTIGTNESMKFQNLDDYNELLQHKNNAYKMAKFLIEKFDFSKVQVIEEDDED